MLALALMWVGVPFPWISRVFIHPVVRRMSRILVFFTKVSSVAIPGIMVSLTTSFWPLLSVACSHSIAIQAAFSSWMAR